MNLITDEFKSFISTSSEYGKKVENISVNENHGGVQLKISFKNGTSASCINTGYGSEEGLWEIMPSSPNPFTSDVYGRLSVSELVGWLKKLADLPDNQNMYSFSKEEIKALESCLAPFNQGTREDMAEELSDKLIMEELLDYGFACTFAKCEFDEVGFDPDNKEDIMEIVNEFIVQTNLKSGKKQLEKPKSKGLPKP